MTTPPWGPSNLTLMISWYQRWLIENSFPSRTV